MKDIFTPLFLLSLSLLSASHALAIYPALLPPFLGFFFTLALIFYGLKKFKISYLFITLSIALLITFSFLQDKETFTQKKSITIPDDQYITLSGELLDFPEIKKTHTVIYLKTSHLEFNKQHLSEAVNIRIKIKGAIKQLNRGDTISINARVYPGLTSQGDLDGYSPGGKDYPLLKKIHFNGYCKSPLLVTVIKKAPFYWRVTGTWRSKIRNALEKKFLSPEGNMNPRGVFLEAILLGDRGRLGPEMKDELLGAGVYHLLAISGAHIGIIALLLLFIFKKIGMSLRSRYVVAGIIILLFLGLSGFKISAQRAVVMALIFFLAKIFYLDFNIYNIISFAGVLLLIKEPSQFLDAGFILTFTLTAAIVMGRNIFLPFFKNTAHLPGFIGELLSANLSASLIALPLSLFFFNRFSFAGFIAGLVLYPLTALITALAIMLIPVVLISETLAGALLILADFALIPFFSITSFLSGPINWSIFRASPHLLNLLLALILFYALSLKEKLEYKPRVSLLIFLLFLVCLIYPVIDPVSYRPANLEVYFMDVGQGDSQIIVFPGGDALLIDGGGNHLSDFQTGKQILLPFILQKRIKIKWMALSHFHADHVEGLIEILPIIKPKELWISSMPEADPYYCKLREVLKNTKSIKVRQIDSNFLMVHRGIKVECLFPNQFIENDFSTNNQSQVLKISDRFRSFLFTGDIEKETETFLTQETCHNLGAQVLKVPHHGSRTSSGRKFLKCVQPELAIFSYSKYNHFNFPHPQVTETYKNLAISRLATAKRGHIKLTSLAQRIKIETAR